MNQEELVRVETHSLHLVITSNRVSRLFWFGPDEVGIENNERSEFFQRSKSSGVPVTQPAGCGGEGNKMHNVLIC